MPGHNSALSERDSSLGLTQKWRLAMCHEYYTGWWRNRETTTKTKAEDVRTDALVTPAPRQDEKVEAAPKPQAKEEDLVPAE
jgi:hypothetical protein